MWVYIGVENVLWNFAMLSFQSFIHKFSFGFFLNGGPYSISRQFVWHLWLKQQWSVEVFLHQSLFQKCFTYNSTSEQCYWPDIRTKSILDWILSEAVGECTKVHGIIYFVVWHTDFLRNLGMHSTVRYKSSISHPHPLIKKLNQLVLAILLSHLLRNVKTNSQIVPYLILQSKAAVRPRWYTESPVEKHQN
jgi:hypothetical protein